MSRTSPAGLLLAVAWAAGCARAAPSSPSPETTRVSTRSGAALEVRTFVDGLEVPWSMAFTSPERLLVTERPGRVRVVERGALQARPLAVISDVEARGESGLMGIALSPDYARSRELYLCYAYDAPIGTDVRVARYRDDGDGLSQRKVLLQGIPAAPLHAGCRLRFGPDGKLYATTGDATDGRIAQDLASLGGKTLRLNPDGTIPADNPVPGSPVFSFGHRNSQGLDWDPRSGALIETEHGPSGFDGPGGGDEVNLVEAGKNYGWPIVHHRDSREGMVSPLYEYTPAVAPSGASFSRGDLLPTFRGDFFFATLRGERLIRLRFDPKEPRRVLETEELLQGVYGRLRDVVSGPDGALYVATSNRDGRGRPRSGDDRILRVVEGPGLN